MSPPDRPVQDAQARDAAAADDPGAAMAAYGPALRRFFFKRAPPGEAEDLVQEVFVRLMARSASEPVDNIERFLFKIAHNVLIDRQRHGQVEARVFRPVAAPREPACELSPERIVMGRQAVTRLVVGLRGLPPRTRKAFLLHRFEEMTYAAIARRMGVSVSAVEQLISRALEHLALRTGVDR